MNQKQQEAYDWGFKDGQRTRTIRAPLPNPYDGRTSYGRAWRKGYEAGMKAPLPTKVSLVGGS